MSDGGGQTTICNASWGVIRLRQRINLTAMQGMHGYVLLLYSRWFV